MKCSINLQTLGLELYSPVQNDIDRSILDNLITAAICNVYTLFMFNYEAGIVTLQSSSVSIPTSSKNCFFVFG